jgi:hypothetical protein
MQFEFDGYAFDKAGVTSHAHASRVGIRALFMHVDTAERRLRFWIASHRHLSYKRRVMCVYVLLVEEVS